MLDDEAREKESPRIAASRAEGRALPGHQGGRRGVIERAGSKPAALLLPWIGRHRLDETLDAVERGAQQALVLAGQFRRALVFVFERRRERLVSARLADGALYDVECVDVGGAFPQGADLCVAHQARAHPFLDVTQPATHLERMTRDRDVVAAGAELVDRREDAQQV